MKGVHEIDLGPWPPALVVIADKAAYRRFARAQCGKGADVSPFPPRNGGCCQKWVDGSSCLFVITLGEQSDQIELAGTLAHEAAHATRWLFAHLCEDKPGQEAEAYLIDHIVRKGLRALQD